MGGAGRSGEHAGVRGTRTGEPGSRLAPPAAALLVLAAACGPPGAGDGAAGRDGSARRRGRRGQHGRAGALDRSAVVAVVGDGLDALVGQNGQVLEAVQELTRLAVVRETGVRSRLMLDIGGWRAARKEELTTIGTRAATRALESGEPVRLAPMTPFERKVVHDAVAGVDGVSSESEGVEPERRVVVLPS